ncbi:MAG: rhodanese-related sulfurtransferase [Ignavibacteria bacterium]|nr:rhodanese-related sulfurtransferase [Ignavibacteria bacterium]
MILYNKIDKEILKEQLNNETFKRVTLSFYKFVEISEPQVFRDQLFIDLTLLNVFGRIYIAPEGINAQLNVPEHNLTSFIEFIENHPIMNGVLLNKAIEDDGKSFYKLKILVKHKVLSDGLVNSDFDIYNVGQHLDAVTYNKKLSEPDTVVIDLRNHYEHEVGFFENAILPEVETYKESIPIIVEMLEEKQPNNIMLYCTGGIRCEKFSAYLKHKGFTNVFQLKGGVINYAHQIKQFNLESKFKGKNFVFDDRMGERVTDDIIAHCHQCGELADTHVNCANDACHLLFIQCEACSKKYNQCCSTECMEMTALPEEVQKEMRKGKIHPNAHHKSKYQSLTF